MKSTLVFLILTTSKLLKAQAHSIAQECSVYFRFIIATITSAHERTFFEPWELSW